MMYKDMIDEIIARKQAELETYRKGYRMTKFSSQLEAAEHVQRCIDSLRRLREKAPERRRSVRPPAETFKPRENPTLEELLVEYSKNIPKIK